MKKVLALALLVTLLGGCATKTGKYTNQSITQEDSIYATRYDSFNGGDFVDIVLKDRSHVIIEVETLAGSLDIAFVEKGDIKREDPFIDEKDIETSQLEGTVEAGEYQLIVNGENHQGGYGIKYE